MITPEKIDDWIREVQERPTSAPIIIQYIANRLRELSDRNEQLLADNISLSSGKRVADYEQKIAHLEYQIDLLKRQMGSDRDEKEAGTPGQPIHGGQVINLLSVIIYTHLGRIMRFEISPQSITQSINLAQISGQVLHDEEPPRLLVVGSTEEIMFVFTSGRIVTAPVMDIPAIVTMAGANVETVNWEQAILHDEPRGGERLACLTPISKLPVSQFFIQISRRGFVKKIRTSMAQSVLANRYIGSGVKQSLDRTFSVCLSEKNEQDFVLASHEGFLLRLGVSKISSSIEEAMRLGASDHLVSSFILHPGTSLLAMTQSGKAIQMTDDRIEVARVMKTKGQAAFSMQRREKGARLVGAGSVRDQDCAVGFHKDGLLRFYSVREILDSGAVPIRNDLLSFEVFPILNGIE